MGANHYEIANEWLNEYNNTKFKPVPQEEWVKYLYWICWLILIVVVLWCCWVMLFGKRSTSVLGDIETQQLPSEDGRYPPVASVRRYRYDGGDNYECSTCENSPIDG